MNFTVVNRTQDCWCWCGYKFWLQQKTADYYWYVHYKQHFEKKTCRRPAMRMPFKNDVLLTFLMLNWLYCWSIIKKISSTVTGEVNWRFLSCLSCDIIKASCTVVLNHYVTLFNYFCCEFLFYLSLFSVYRRLLLADIHVGVIMKSSQL